MKVIDPSTEQIKDSIRYYQLKFKQYRTDLSPQEGIEFKEHIKKRFGKRNTILQKEIERSTGKLNEIAVKYGDTIRTLTYLCFYFENELLLPYELPIWWDFERFLHIFIRHVKETKVGERFDEKTIFQYKFDEIQKIVEAVLESVYKDIYLHFKERPKENFRRMGSRSIYYDGNYYRVEIEPNGRLLTFHPYNDSEETEN
jgi:hypothetical protein